MAPRWDKRLRLPKSEGGATICEKHEFIEAHFRDPEMSWEVDQAVTQAKDDGKRMEARLQELGEEANNLEDALSETEADRDRLAAELQAVRDELATAYEEIILSRQSEGDTMADLLATREERDKLRAELDRLKTSPTGERIIVHAWSLHDHPSGCVQFAVANDSTIWERSMVGRWDSEFGGWREQLGDWSQVECDGIEGFPPLPQPAPEIVVSGETLNHVLRSTANEGREG